MPVDQETSELIRKQAFPGGGRLARGEHALEVALADESIPNPVAWMVDPGDVGDDPPFATVYLLAAGAVYRLRARRDAGDANDPSECACDFVRVGADARFALHVVHHWAEGSAHLEDVRTWRFNLGDGETFEVQTTTPDRGEAAPAERDAFARALASAIDGARVR